VGETVSCLSAPIKTEIKEMTSVKVAEREKNKKEEETQVRLFGI